MLYYLIQKKTFEEERHTIVGLLKPIINFEFNESDENLAKDVDQPHESWEETKSKVAKEELHKLCVEAQQKFGQLKHVYEQFQQVKPTRQMTNEKDLLH